MSIYKGEFNSLLKKTGFLAQPKMEARLISRHPQRFLESYADRKIGILSSENEALDQFLHQVRGAGDYERKAAILRRKQLECKNRAFLLSLATSPAVSPDLVQELSFNNNNGSNNGTSEEAPAINYEEMIEHYLTEIKMADKEDVETWVASTVKMNDMKLPYGLPENLRMPMDPKNIEDDGIYNFIDTANDEFLLLDGEYHTKLEELTQKLSQNYEELSQGSRWTVAESSLLYFVITNLDETLSVKTSLQSDLTRRLFPLKNQEDIIKQKYLLKSKRGLEEKRGNIIRDWLRDKSELQAKVNAAWENLHKDKVRKLQTTLKVKKQREICLEWAKLVSKMRREKSEKVKNLKIMVEPLQKKLLEDHVQKVEKERVRKEEVRSAAKTFRERKVEEKFNLARSKAETSRLEEKLRKAQLQIHKNRVEFRKTETEQKRLEKLAQEQREAEEKQRKKDILEKMKQKPQLDYDPFSVLADTHAAMVRNHEIMRSNQSRKEQDEDQEMVNFFRKQYSFAADQIWADRRVKVEAKLRDAGLLGSTYARQVLQAMQPQEKPHLRSTMNFEAGGEE